MSKLLIALGAAFLSALLILSIPLLNMTLKTGTGDKDEIRIVARAEVKKMDIAKPKEQPRREIKRPQRPKPVTTRTPSGPRFAMDLGVGGAGGALVPMQTANRSGTGGVGSQGGVDDLPEAQNRISLRIPAELQAAERDALVVLSFCVDVAGRPYDLRVVEERPTGLGLAEAGREALREALFRPARKGGTAVAFCGMEQPFEVRFGG